MKTLACLLSGVCLVPVFIFLTFISILMWIDEGREGVTENYISLGKAGLTFFLVMFVTVWIISKLNKICKKMWNKRVDMN